MRRIRKQIAVLCSWMILLSSLMTVPSVATQTNRIWDGGAAGDDGKMSTAANWSGDTLPLIGDTVILDNTSAKACTSDIVDTVQRLIIRASHTTGPFVLGANLVLNGGDSLASGDSIHLKSYTLEIAHGDHYEVGGKVSAGTSLLKFTETAATQQQYNGASFYYDIEIARNANQRVILNTTMKTNRNLTVTTGAFHQNAKAVSVGGDFNQNSTTTWTISNAADSIKMTGANGTLHIASGATPSGTSTCKLILMASGQTIDDDKGVFWGKVRVPTANSQISFTGAALNHFAAAANGDTVLVMANGCKITNTNDLYFSTNNKLGVYPWAFGSNDTISGTGQCLLGTNGANSSSYILFPSVYNSTGVFSVSNTSLDVSAGRDTARILSNIDIGHARFQMLGKTKGNYIVYLNNISITAGWYKTGGDAADDTSTFVYGANTINCDSIGNGAAGYSVGRVTDSLGSAVFNVAGGFTGDTNTNYSCNPQTSTYNFTGAGSIRVGNQRFANVNINNAGTSTVTGLLRLSGNLGILAGTLTRTNSAGSDSISGNVSISSGATLNLSGDSSVVAGDWTTGATGIVTTDATTLCRLTKAGISLSMSGNTFTPARFTITGPVNFVSSAILALAGGTFTVCSVGTGKLTVTGGGTFPSLKLNRGGGDSLTLSYGDTFTISTLDSLDWSGAAATPIGRNYVFSSLTDTACSSRAAITVGTGDTVGFANMKFKNVGTTAGTMFRCRTGCTSGGGGILCP